MDPVTQGALGSALAASTPRRDRVLAALLLGALAGMAPDLDVLIRSPTDSLLFLEYHRQFTHALAFVPVGALLCAVLAHGVVRRRLRFRETYAFCLLGYASHGLLDACTSYGTQLLWPFSDARIAWNVVAVVDPLVTVPALGLLTAAAVKRRRWFAGLALAWVLLYLTFGQLQSWRAERAAAELADARGHVPERLAVKPSFGNLLLWKSVYLANGFFYVDAVRVGVDPGYFPGSRIERLGRDPGLSWLQPGSRQAADLRRFRHFSSDHLALSPDCAHCVIDVRYSLLPNDIDPLWGIRLNPGRQNEHARYFTDRETTAADRRALWRMLVGPGRTLDETVSGR